MFINIKHLQISVYKAVYKGLQCVQNKASISRQKILNLNYTLLCRPIQKYQMICSADNSNISHSIAHTKTEGVSARAPQLDTRENLH